MASSTSASADQPSAGFLSAFKRPSVRVLAVSRASSKLAGATVSYGSMVYLASAGGSQWQISLVAASTYLSAVLFGLQGGLLADSLSKRLAIVAGFVAQAALCILIPFFFGTGATQFVVIMFFSSALMQIVSPSLKSAIALVATPDEMATVAASISIVGSIGSAIGSSLLAPILIKTTQHQHAADNLGRDLSGRRNPDLPTASAREVASVKRGGGARRLATQRAIPPQNGPVARRQSSRCSHDPGGSDRCLPVRSIQYLDSGLRPGCPEC